MKAILELKEAVENKIDDNFAKIDGVLKNIDDLRSLIEKQISNLSIDSITKEILDKLNSCGFTKIDQEINLMTILPEKEKRKK